MNKVKFLLTYRYSEIIHDLTVEFTRKYIDYRSRTKDQMEQAARSGKQNIVEGVAQGQTSKKGEIKLLGVAKSSLVIYPKTSSQVTAFRKTAFRLSHLRNLSDLGDLIEKPSLPSNPQDAANFLLTLCHQVTYLLDRQIKAAEGKFIKEGGYTENLFKKRLERKNYEN